MPGVPSLSSSMPWVKLWLDFLDDPKIGMLPDSAQLFFVKLMALAGESDAEGYLVNGEAPLSEKQIAWRFRISEDAAHLAIEELEALGIVAWDEGYLLIVNFSKRQGRSQQQKREQWVERQQRSRSKKTAIVTSDIANVTRDNGYCHARVTPAEEEGEKEKEGEKVGEVGRGGDRASHDWMSHDWVPKNPKQAMRHPDIQIFREAAERIPGIGQYATAIQTVQLLRQKVPEEAALIEYLSRFWLAWSGRKTKDGRPYDASSLVWLTEWAVNDYIPPNNGSDPAPKSYTAAEKKKRAREEYQRQLAALEAQDAGTNDNNDHLAGGAEGDGQAAAQPGVGGRTRAGQQPGLP